MNGIPDAAAFRVLHSPQDPLIPTPDSMQSNRSKGSLESYLDSIKVVKEQLPPRYLMSEFDPVTDITLYPETSIFPLVKTNGVLGVSHL